MFNSVTRIRIVMIFMYLYLCLFIVFKKSCFSLAHAFVGFGSAFTVKEVTWSDDPNKRHEIVIAASMNNKTEDMYLPLAPWY